MLVLEIKVMLEINDVDIFDGFSISWLTFHLRISYPSNAKR